MTTEQRKENLIETLLRWNPNLTKVDSSTVKIGPPALIPCKGGFKMVNMTLTIPSGAHYEGRDLV